MRSPTSLRRHTALLTVLGVVIGLVLLVPRVSSAAPVVATGTPSQDESQFLTKLNQERQRRGVAPLVLDTRYSATARDWSATMRARGSLTHDPGLRSDATAVEPAWRAIGENIGVGYGVQSLHDAFMASAGHRTNVLKAAFNRVGVGVAHAADGKIWVTVRFMDGPAIAGTTGLGPPPGIPSLLHGDFDGDGFGDLLTYGPGSAPDELWFGAADRSLRRRAVTVAGHWRPVAGDFNGDGTTEILWYAPGTKTDVLWTWNGSGFSSRKVTVNGTYTPLSGDFDGDGRDDILWYAPGTAADTWWYGNGNGGFSPARASVAGAYRPAVGNFDGVHGDDILWYGPGTASDRLWYATGTRGRFTPVSLSVGGSYKPFAGDFDGSGTEDIFWYAPGKAQDATWYMDPQRGSFRRVLRTVAGSAYVPGAEDLDGNSSADIVWYAPSSASGDPLWWGIGTTSVSPSRVG